MERKLMCLTLIEREFGPTVRKLTEMIMNMGDNAPTRKISLSSTLNKQTFDLSVFILERHSCLKNTDESFRLDIDAILARACFEQYLVQISAEFDVSAEVIVQSLILHGKCNHHQLLECALQFLDASGSDKEIVIKHLELSLSKLIEALYVKEDKLATHMSKKRKTETTETVSSSSGGAVYSLNFAKFHTTFISSQIERMLSERYNEFTMSIWKCLASFYLPEHFEFPETNCVSEEDIFNRMNAECGRGKLMQYLEEMAEEEKPAIEQGSSGNIQGYFINFISLCHELRFRYICSLISNSIGPQAVRIFRFIYEKRKVEEKQVVDVCLFEKSACKKMLYRLAAKKFLTITEFPSASERTTVKPAFLWSVPLEAIYEQIRTICYSSWCNIHEYHSSKRREYSLIINKRESLTEVEKTQFEQWKVIDTRCKSSLIHLADTLILFRNFLKNN